MMCQYAARQRGGASLLLPSQQPGRIGLKLAPRAGRQPEAARPEPEPESQRQPGTSSNTLDTWWSSTSAKVFKQRCELFRAGRYGELWADSAAYAPDTDASATGALAARLRAEREALAETSEEERRHQRVVKLVQKGDVSKQTAHCCRVYRHAIEV
jgi:hypothetical protein